MLDYARTINTNVLALDAKTTGITSPRERSPVGVRCLRDAYEPCVELEKPLAGQNLVL